MGVLRPLSGVQSDLSALVAILVLRPDELSGSVETLRGFLNVRSDVHFVLAGVSKPKVFRGR
jgi:hypothetical protein